MSASDHHFSHIHQQACLIDIVDEEWRNESLQEHIIESNVHAEVESNLHSCVCLFVKLFALIR